MTLSTFNRASLGIFWLAAVFFFFSISEAYAEENISVSPLIIDHVTEARDILKQDITIKNNGDRPVRLYATVHEIKVGDDNEIQSFVPPSMTDRKTSITSWLEISRARISLQPGEETKIPLTIRINPNAKPGDYHAFVSFPSGANADIAEAKAIAGEAEGLVVRVSIDEKQIELLRLTSFDADTFVLDDSHNFTFSLENAGDIDVVPSGEIIIYNSKGQELTAIPVNDNNVSIPPQAKTDFSIPVPQLDGFGKNKAYLSLEYGEKNLATVYDTIYYYSIPWLLAIIMLSLLIILPVIMTLVFHRIARPTYPDYEHIDEGIELPLFVRKSHDHKIHDHDIDLKKKD
ncbi:MAG: hypothetical protein H6779_00095 [Candidatus Nomurabacteria bacterium]|nr:MAG: hypothetical protein H6779_00095 [Candidatus Nomurabacteria bacterium]